MAEIDLTVQQNSASANEIAAITTKLSHEFTQLQNVVKELG